MTEREAKSRAVKILAKSIYRDLEALGARLEAGELDAEQATALLEQITALVHEAVDVLEFAGEGLESSEGEA